MTVPDALAHSRGVVVDTMVFIYLLEDHPVYGERSEWVVRWAEAGHFSGLLTPISMAEILVKPLRTGRTDLADRYRRALQSLPNIAPCDLSCRTGVMAGALRAKYGLPLPDMLQAACAMEHAGVLVTNDKALRAVEEIHVVLLDDLR